MQRPCGRRENIRFEEQKHRKWGRLCTRCILSGRKVQSSDLVRDFRLHSENKGRYWRVSVFVWFYLFIDVLSWMLGGRVVTEYIWVLCTHDWKLWNLDLSCFIGFCIISQQCFSLPTPEIYLMSHPISMMFLLKPSWQSRSFKTCIKVKRAIS